MDAAAAGVASAAGAPAPAAAGGEQQQQAAAPPRAERLSVGVHQQLNLEGMWVYPRNVNAENAANGKHTWDNSITVDYATNAVFGMGATNTTSMMGMQQQQQGVYGNMQGGAQNIQQQGMVGLQNQQNQMQNPNFSQQRQQNQQ